jgi:hypothetical protein
MNLPHSVVRGVGTVRLIALIALIACSRAPSGSGSDTQEHAEHSGSSATAAANVRPSVSTGQAQYMLLGVLNPLLHPYLQVLGDHFGGEGQTPFAVQRVDLAGGRRALLVSRANETDPLLLVSEGAQLIWSKGQPLVGLGEPLVHPALTPGSDGGVALFVYSTSSHSVQARTWKRDGTASADHRVLSMEGCDALSAACGEIFGWIVVCVLPSATRAQRLTPDGATPWGDAGAAVGVPSGPPTIVFDTPGTWMLVATAKKGDQDHLLAFRYDARGQPLWPDAADIGVVHATSRGVRPSAALTSSGAVRIDLPGGVAGSHANAADVDSAGAVHLIELPRNLAGRLQP